jgi:hypothetical protein
VKLVIPSGDSKVMKEESQTVNRLLNFLGNYGALELRIKGKNRVKKGKLFTLSTILKLASCSAKFVNLDSAEKIS